MEHSILQLSSKYLWKWIWCIHWFIFVEIQLSHYYHFIIFWHFFDTFLKWGFDTFEIHLGSLTVFWHIFADLWHIFDTFMFLAILLSFNYHFIVFWHIFDSFLTHLWHILGNSGTSHKYEYQVVLLATKPSFFQLGFLRPVTTDFFEIWFGCL